MFGQGEQAVTQRLVLVLVLVWVLPASLLFDHPVIQHLPVPQSSSLTQIVLLALHPHQEHSALQLSDLSEECGRDRPLWVETLAFVWVPMLLEDGVGQFR